MKNSNSLLEKIKRPLRAPYRYYLLRAKALKISFNEWRTNDYPLPVPPPLLRYRVHGKLKLQGYLQVGQNCANDIKTLLGQVGKDFYSFENVLDFGCGSGRVLRYFHDRPPTCHLYGTDIDKEAIAWCQNNLHFAKWGVNDSMPPMSYQNHTFDFIYAISVFTHLDEKMQFAWLEELKRISKPGGVLILSIHGQFCHSNLSQTKQASVSEKGILFDVRQTGKFKHDSLPDFYQNTYHTREYIDENWSRFFKIIGYQSRGINEHQDAVILQNL